MGLGGCYSILKYLVFIVNLIFWLSGLSIIVLSLWMLLDSTFYISMAQDESSYYSGVYVFLAVGILMFIVGFLGCCGTIRESQCMLVLFFCFLLLVLVAEISAATWAYANSNKLEKLIRENVEITVLQEYGEVKSRTETFDAIQQGLQCCGAQDPTDWMSSKFNHADLGSLVDLKLSSSTQRYKIPLSCCHDEVNASSCLTTKYFEIGAPIVAPYFSKGCSDKLVATIVDSMSTVVVVGVCIAICQILGLIFSLILCCGIQNRDRYKS